MLFHYAGLQRKPSGLESLPTGSDLLSIISLKRKDTTDKYATLMKVFAPAVVTHTRLRNQIVAGWAWSETVTVSDEAFVLLALENYWNLWITNDNMKIKLPEGSSEHWPLNKAKWSTSGRGKNAAKFAGWAPEAMSRLADLEDEVEADRKVETDAMEAAKKRATSSGSSSAKKRLPPFDKKMRELVVDDLSESLKNQLDAEQKKAEANVAGESSSTQAVSVFAKRIRKMD